MCHVAYQSGYQSLRSLYPIKGPFKISTALTEFGRKLRNENRQPKPDDKQACLAMGIILPLPGISDFVLLAGRPYAEEGIRDGVLDVHIDPFGVGAHKPLGRSDEEIEVRIWLIPMEVIKNCAIEPSILRYKGDFGDIRIYQCLLDEQKDFGRDELNACELVNTTFSELLQYKSWISLYRPELFFLADTENSTTPADSPEGPEFVKACLLPSFMDLLALCFQLNRSSTSFMWPMKNPRKLLGDTSICLHALLDFYDPEGKSYFEVGTKASRPSALDLGLFKDRSLPSFEVIFQIASTLKESPDDLFPFEDLIPLSVLYQKTSATQSDNPPARKKFRKPVTTIHVVPTLQTSLLQSKDGFLAHLQWTKQKAMSAGGQKYFTWAKPEQGVFGLENHVLTENHIYPMALFYTHEEAWCTLQNMQDVQGGPEELTVARASCMEPTKLAELLLPKAREIDEILRLYGQEFSLLCLEPDK